MNKQKRSSARIAKKANNEQNDEVLGDQSGQDINSQNSTMDGSQETTPPPFLNETNELLDENSGNIHKEIMPNFFGDDTNIDYRLDNSMDLLNDSADSFIADQTNNPAFAKKPSNEEELMKLFDNTLTGVDISEGNNLALRDFFRGQKDLLGEGFVKVGDKICDKIDEQNDLFRRMLALIEPTFKNIPAIVGQTEKRRSVKPRVSDPMKEVWKNDILIYVNNEEKSIMNYTREEVADMVKANQSLWKSPKILDLDLKENIQQCLYRFFSMIDQPRKFGWAVGQFLHDAQFYQHHFILPVKEKGDKTKSRESSGRETLNPYETKLLFDTLLYCGGRMIVPFPYGDKSQKNYVMEFLRACRESINQQGYALKDKLNYVNHMAKIPGFIPILEREDVKFKVEGAITAYESEKQRKKDAKHQQHKAEKRMASNIFRSPLFQIGNIGNTPEFGRKTNLMDVGDQAENVNTLEELRKKFGESSATLATPAPPTKTLQYREN